MCIPQIHWIFSQVHLQIRQNTSAIWLPNSHLSIAWPEDELIQINFDILMYDLPCCRPVLTPWVEFHVWNWNVLWYASSMDFILVFFSVPPSYLHPSFANKWAKNYMHRMSVDLGHLGHQKRPGWLIYIKDSISPLQGVWHRAEKIWYQSGVFQQVAYLVAHDG